MQGSQRESAGFSVYRDFNPAAMDLIDTHTHLDSFARRGNLEDVLARAREAGVGTMVAIGTEPSDWALYRDLARTHAGVVHYSAGLHPCSVDSGWAPALAQLPDYWGSEAPRPVAVGEIGLDRFHLPKDQAEAERIFGWQKAAFAEGLALAKRLGCPVVVHSRGAFADCVQMIDQSGVDWQRVVFHCFAEGPNEMAELNRRGGRGSFTGIVTYKTADGVRAAATAQGLDRLMIETDAPYLAPMPNRGKPNEPAYLRLTAEYCARLFGCDLETFARSTTASARQFFGI
jgi:TatD DNase family protein